MLKEKQRFKIFLVEYAATKIISNHLRLKNRKDEELKDIIFKENKYSKQIIKLDKMIELDVQYFNQPVGEFGGLTADIRYL